MKNKIFQWSCAVLLFAGAGAPAGAADYLGADGVLRAVAERNAQPGEKTGKDDQPKIREELKAFGQTVTNLAPAEAARQWLALADKAAALESKRGMSFERGGPQVQGDDLLMVLPPPPVWPELAKAVAGRPAVKGSGEIREIGLRLLTATLTGDGEAQNREINKLSAKAKAAGYQESYFYRNYLEQISEAMLAMSDQPDTVLKSLRRQLENADAHGSQQVEVPNLVSQVGEEKARAFLKQALTTPNVTIQFRQPNETSRLAQKLALELMDQLKSAQWGLVNSLDATALYEALDKRFGKTTNAPAEQTISAPNEPNLPDLASLSDDFDSSGKGEAQVYYMLGLIAHDRTKEAVTVAKKLKGARNQYSFEAAFNAMEHAGYADALDSFLHELLAQDPELPFWDQYVEFAVRAGHADQMLALIRSTAGREELSDARKTTLHEILFKALLAADKPDEAVPEMRKLMADTKSKSENNLDAGRLGLMLARLGVLLKNPAWVEEGIGAAKQWATNSEATKTPYENFNTQLAGTLTGLDRGPEAEGVLVTALAEATRTNKSSGSEYNRGGWNSSPALEILTSLATLYDRAGRPDDVLRLLDQSADWGTGDLSGLFRSECGGDSISIMWLHAGSSPGPLPYLAAKALMAAGRNEPAQKITDAILEQYPGLDRGYELLIALKGSNAIPQLDALYGRDQFEERPLIWKAHLLRQQNRLEEAEKILRQAISIDPSDGEEGRGDRMRVYAELAEVREARGDKKEADFYREVVKAIRLSEDADEFYAAGLLKRAIGMYEEGLKHFSDAYCIQSRLAIQMSALGMNEAAEEHYRRAYELMPDSFGRVESHCFGCEKAFDGERPQSIAEKVFTKMMEDRPDKPQIHYLLGYLRLEQERYNEAPTNYLAAVRLDPEYLNAWVKLQETGEQTLVPPKERDDVVFNMLRLDPLRRHAQPEYARVSDLAGLWQAVATAITHELSVNTNLLTLAASKAAVEKKEKELADRRPRSDMRFDFPSFRSSQEQDFSPARAVSETSYIRLAGEMILDHTQTDD